MIQKKVKNICDIIENLIGTQFFDRLVQFKRRVVCRHKNTLIVVLEFTQKEKHTHAQHTVLCSL